MGRTTIANLKGPQGKTGPRGLPGTNGVATDEAVAEYIDADDSATGAAAQARIDATIDPKTAGNVQRLSTSETALAISSYVATAAVDVPPFPFNIRWGYNLNPKWSDAVKRVRSGGGNAKVLCIGDSTTYGSGASNPNGFVNQNSWPTRMAQYLDRVVAVTSYGLVIPPGEGSSDPEKLIDSRWNLGAGWERGTATGAGLGGKNSTYRGSVAGGPLTFGDSRIAYDRYDVYYLTNTGGSLGTFSVSATGGTAQTVQTGNQTEMTIRKVTINAGSKSTSNRVSITNTGTSGNVYIIGVEPWVSGTSRIYVGNAGVSASRTTDWLFDATGSDAWNVLKFFGVYQPDLTIIDLGVNDASTLDPTTFVQNMETIAAAATAAGSAVMYKAMFPSQGTRADTEAAFVAGLINTRRPVLDLFTHYGSWDRNDARGWMADALHGNDNMYGDVGALAAAALLQYAV